MSLNPAQLRAVEHAAGPLIVLAGPGTGKTRVIVHRIAHQIQQRGVKPERIIAATFTVKAAEELRVRLAEIVSPAVAQRVRAGTLHAMGSAIVRRYADQLGLPSRMSMIDAAMSRRVLRGVIEDRQLFRSSRAEGLPTLCDRLLSLFDAMADRGVLPDHASAHAAKMRDTAQDDTAKAAAGVFADSADAYGEYCGRRWERGRLCFADFVLLPILGMTQRPTLRAMVRGECAAFVVDEFQDCNAGQIELLRLLAGYGGAAGGDTGPDICVVGDDDQAIYAFRGADERAFERFTRIWPGAAVVELAENYRSVSAIVHAANSVIVRAGASRFRPEKQVRATRGNPAGPHGVTIVTFDQEHEDAETIAAMIVLERAKHRASFPGTPLPKTAVIARTNTDLDRIAAVLTLEGVSWSRRREASMLDDAGVQDVLAWIEWLLHPGATWSARRIMARPPYSIDARVLAEWEREHRSLHARARLAEDAAGTPPPFHEWLLQKATGGGDAGSSEVSMTGALASARRVMETYTTLRAKMAGERADELLDLLIRTTGTAHAELLPGRERASRIRALVALLRLARDKQRDLDAPGDLAAFWAYFTDLRDADPALKNTGSSELHDDEEELDRENRGTQAEMSGDAASEAERVHLLTAHSAKGLEFDTVYVTRVKPPHGFPKSKVDEVDWEMPEGLVEQLDTRDAKTRKLDEERRLFYVACTRARTRLVLLGAHKGKVSTASMHFLDEFLFDAPGVEFTRTTSRDVLRDAAAMGFGVLARTALEATGLDYAHRRGAGERLAELARQARVAASHALERASRADLTPDDLAVCEAELSHAARVLAITGRGDAPAWLTAGQVSLEKVANRVADLRVGQSAEPSRVRLRPPVAPLPLSYTYLDQYERCPLCWYLRYVLRLPSPESDEARTGTVVHAALDRFVKAWTNADSEGAARPGLTELLRMGKAALIEELGKGAAVSDEDAGTVDAQLRSYYERFHDPASQTIETERTIEVPYVVDGITHTLTAKIDRVDLTQDNTYRVIDYKTGKGWANLREPKKDDLQFGVYAIALRHAHQEEGALRGTSEYWLLATGERGVLALQDLREDKVRGQIDASVRAILAGEFERDKECTGACTLFAE